MATTKVADQPVAATGAKDEGKKPVSVTTTEIQGNISDAGADADASGSDDDDAPGPAEGGGAKKKKKSKKKNNKKKKKNLPAAVDDAAIQALIDADVAALEKAFAERPMTEQEANDEKTLYATDRPFFERIETCVQRYVARRRFSPEQKALFDLYLFLGGIDSSPRQFSGAADLDTADMSKQEIRDASTSVAIPRAGGSAKFYTPGDPNWDVDFLGIVQGFFGETLLAHTGFNLREIRTGVIIVDNFLRYVAHHDVCPEYRNQLQDALDFCPKAWADLGLTFNAMCSLPGAFNLSCQHLFNSLLQDKPLQLNPEKQIDPNVLWSCVMNERENMAFSAYAPSWRHIQGYIVDKEEECTFEVVEYLPPTDNTKKNIRAANAKYVGAEYPVIASILVKDTHVENGWHVPEDVRSGRNFNYHTLWVEDACARNFKPGMKIIARVCRLQNGVTFVTKPHCVMPEWYVYLPQNLMARYTEPGLLPSKEAAGKNYDSDGSTKVDE